MPFAGVNGANIWYEVAGEGDTLVFLHAGIADSRMWNDQAAAFAQHYRVLRYDLRGFGQTTAPAMPYTHHDDLRALLDQLGIERAAVIGCSNGGRVAMNFALAYPQRVSALVMVCSSPGGFQSTDDPPSSLWDEIVEASEAGDLERTSRLETQFWAVGPERSPDAIPKAMFDLVSEMNLTALQNEAAGVGDEQSMSPPAVERLSEIQVPVLVIVGADDHASTHQSGSFMQASLAHVKKVVMPNTAHLPSMEHPDEFNQLVFGFLETVL